MYRPAMIILLFFSMHANAQQHRLQGILLDKNKAEPVAGATILSGADTAISKKDGQFNIRITGDQLHLKIEHPHYKTATFSPKAVQSFMPIFIAPATVLPDQADSSGSFHPDSVVAEETVRAYRNETYKKEKENPFIETSQYPYTAFALNSGYAAYNNVRRFLSQEEKVPTAAVRIGEMLNYFSFDDPLPVEFHDRPLKAYADFSSCPWNNDHWLMRIAVQSSKDFEKSLKPWNIVLLIDLSGSMSSPDKLPLLKIAFKQLITHLQAKDTLSIITYTEKATLALPPVSGSEKMKMLKAIDQLQAGGTTAGSKGIEKAFELARKRFVPKGNNRVILATDGDFNVGKSTDREMKKLIMQYRNWHINLTCIGVGAGNYKDSKLETLAEWGQGTFSYIDNQAEALRIFNETAFQQMAVIARDVRLKILFDPAQIRAFRLPGYDSDGKNAKYAFVKKSYAPGGEIGADERMTAYVELVPSESHKDINEGNPPVTLILQYKSMPERKDHIQVYRSSGSVVPFGNKNADWRFGTSVVLFGMLLQQSEYVREGNYKMAAEIGRKAKDAIPEEGYKNYKSLLRTGRKIGK